MKRHPAFQSKGKEAAETRQRHLEDVPEAELEREKAIYLAQVKEMGKPKAAWDKIVNGKLEKFYQEQCLIEQAFIKDQNLTIKDLLAQKVAKLGENITISRFTRYQLGQE